MSEVPKPATGLGALGHPKEYRVTVCKSIPGDDYQEGSPGAALTATDEQLRTLPELWSRIEQLTNAVSRLELWSAPEEPEDLPVIRRRINVLEEEASGNDGVAYAAAIEQLQRQMPSLEADVR